MSRGSCSPRWLRDDRRGAALVEFALILPLMLTLYLGGFRLIDAASCYRRVTVTARSLADLVSQYATLNEATLATVMDASTQMMTPYRTTTIRLRVTHIRIDANSRAFVSWSRAKNDFVYPVDYECTAGISPALRSPGTALIYSEVSYDYPSVIWVGGPMTFSQKSIMMPRRSPSVTLTSS